MKRSIWLLAFLLTGLGLFGQTSPVMYLAMVPKYSGDPCSITDADTANIRSWREMMSTFIDSLSADITRRTEALDVFMEEHEDQIRENSLTKLGYSETDARLLKNADLMSDTEKEEMVNAMLMEKMNMDISDFEKLSKMDTASQKRWAQGYSTMMMAEGMADPEKQAKEQKELRNQFDLVNEQKFMIDKMRAGEWKYFQQFDTLQKEAEDAREVMNNEIEDLNKQREDCDNSKCQEAIDDAINKKLQDYCYRFTPEYLKVVVGFRAFVEGSLDDYDALDEINNKVLESQTGIHNPAFSPGLSALTIIRAYADKEASVFLYYNPPKLIGVGAEGGEGGD